MKGQEDVHIIQLPLDNVMSMTHKGKRKARVGFGKDKKKVSSSLMVGDDVCMKRPSRRSYLAMSFENFVVGGSSRRNLTKESVIEETMDLFLNVS